MAHATGQRDGEGVSPSAGGVVEVGTASCSDTLALVLATVSLGRYECVGPTVDVFQLAGWLLEIR